MTTVGTQPRQRDLQATIEREFIRNDAIVLLATHAREDGILHVDRAGVADGIRHVLPFYGFFTIGASRMVLPGETLGQRFFLSERKLILGARLVVAERAQAHRKELAPLPRRAHLRDDFGLHFFVIFF